MTPEEKIADVLKNISDERKISSNPNMVEFNFNDHIVGAGIVRGEDERKILLKLNTEGIIKVIVPENDDAIHRYNYRLEEYIFKLSFVLIEVTDNFDSYYSHYQKYLDVKEAQNYWNYVNPFWLIWKWCQLMASLFALIWRHKFMSAVVSIIMGAIALLTSDYSKISENLTRIMDILNGK